MKVHQTTNSDIIIYIIISVVIAMGLSDPAYWIYFISSFYILAYLIFLDERCPQTIFLPIFLRFKFLLLNFYLIKFNFSFKSTNQTHNFYIPSPICLNILVFFRKLNYVQQGDMISITSPYSLEELDIFIKKFDFSL